MATYVIGDVQGCFLSLMSLLKHIKFKSSSDQIIFLGDLLNRGPDSLEVLRYIYQNRFCMRTVLGNHDIFAIALYLGAIKDKKPHTLQALLAASDAPELFGFLKSCPLLIYENNNLFVHAGIMPAFSIDEALKYARELSQILSGSGALEFLGNYYEKPELELLTTLSKEQFYRLALASYIRMRVCRSKTVIDQSYDGELANIPASLKPWFIFRGIEKVKIFFGHWAALGIYQNNNVMCLDSGCVWGEKLSALRLDDMKLFQVEAQEINLKKTP